MIGQNTFPPRPAMFGGPQFAHQNVYPMTTWQNVTVDMGSYQRVWVPRLVTRPVPTPGYANGYPSMPLNSPYTNSYPTPATTAPGNVPYPPSTSMMPGVPTMWSSPSVSSAPVMMGTSMPMTASANSGNWTPVEPATSPGTVPTPPGTQVVVDPPVTGAYERRSRSGLFSPVRPGSGVDRAGTLGR